MKRLPLLIGLAGLAACEPAPPPVDVQDGYTHVTGNGTFQCAGPTSVDGNHADVELLGPCTRVRVTGSHVDLVAYVDPAAVIEVTGNHVDVVYRLLRPGQPPQWINSGDRNSLIRNSHAPWEQDHDWYQEQH